MWHRLRWRRGMVEVDVDSQRIAMIGSVGAVWITLGGLILLAALFDHDIASQVVTAFIAIALGSVTGSTAVHIFGQPKLSTALAQPLSRVDPQTAASLAPAVMQAQAAQPAPLAAMPPNGVAAPDPNAAGGAAA